MYIVDHERGEIVNMDNITSVYTNRNTVEAITPFGKTTTLGAYSSSDRAKEVFAQMIADCFPPNVFLAQNCEIRKEDVEAAMKQTGPLFISTKGDNTRVERFDVGVYYMPEV